MSSAPTTSIKAALKQVATEGESPQTRLDAQKQDAETTDGSDIELCQSETSSCQQLGESPVSMQASLASCASAPGAAQTPTRFQAVKQGMQTRGSPRYTALFSGGIGSRSLAEPVSGLRSRLRAKGASLMSELMLGDLQTAPPEGLSVGRPSAAFAAIGTASEGSVRQAPQPRFANCPQDKYASTPRCATSPSALLEGCSPAHAWTENAFFLPGLKGYNDVNVPGVDSAIYSYSCVAEFAPWASAPQKPHGRAPQYVDVGQGVHPTRAGSSQQHAMHAFDPQLPVKKRISNFLLRDPVQWSSSAGAKHFDF